MFFNRGALAINFPVQAVVNANGNQGRSYNPWLLQARHARRRDYDRDNLDSLDFG